MKKVLFIAFRFAPSAASGTFRTLGFVRHLSNLGWQIEVLTTKIKNIKDVDNKLLNNVPPGVKIIRAAVFDPFLLWEKIGRKSKQNDLVPEKTVAPPSNQNQFSSFKEKLSHFLKTPDNQIGWFFPALLNFYKLSKPSLVYSSAPPFTSHLIAVILKKIWRVPLICDFRDPWLDNPFRKARPGWVESWEQRLENWVYKNTDSIILNTKPMAAAFRSRHPDAASRIHVITNGYDPDEFAAIESHRDAALDVCLFLHPGALYGQRDPRMFLAAVQRAVFDHGCDKLQIQLIGPSENFGGQSLTEHVNHLGLASHIQIVDSIPHNQALERMKGADYLLLFSQGTTVQIPAKIYEYMGVKKTIFAIVEPDSATQDVMNSLGDDHYSCKNEMDEITEKLVVAYKRFKENKQQLHAGENTNMHKFLRSKLTETLEKVFLESFETRRL